MHVRNSPGHRREQARQRVGDELGAADRHARHVGGDLGRTDRIGGAADRRTPERQPDDHDQRQQQREARRHAARQLAGQRIGQRRVDVAAGNASQRERGPVVDRAGGDRRHDRLQPSVDHDESVDRAAQAADEQHAQHARARSSAASRRRCSTPGNWRAPSPCRPTGRCPTSARPASAPWRRSRAARLCWRRSSRRWR